MVEAPGVRVPRSEAEATRRRLRELDVLRTDLEVGQDGGDVVFPVAEACGPRLPTVPWTFQPRDRRPSSYVDLLAWPADLRAEAPRAFEQLGDIVVVKVPASLQGRAAEVGDALLRFHPGCRAVFHDGGVHGAFRTRTLTRIAGAGDALTQVGENGVRLWVDLGAAYFSPRLGNERARVAAMVRPGEHVVDLFAGVAPAAIQCALRGSRVDAVDLNPAAIVLAERNVTENRVSDRVTLHVGDARAVASRLAPAHRILMNLPHGAKDFLDVAAGLVHAGGTIHYHEILPADALRDRERELVAFLAARQRPVRAVHARIVRPYSAQEVHAVYDLEVAL